MKERIKKLRKALSLTQQEFADRLGISRGNIATYETRDGSPSISVISLICREFGVSEQWLRTGEGEMFSPRTREDELTSAVQRLLSGDSADFKRRLITALASLDDKQWAAIEDKLYEILGARPASNVPDLEAEARAEAEEYYRQRLAEKKAAADASAILQEKDA